MLAGYTEFEAAAERADAHGVEATTRQAVQNIQRCGEGCPGFAAEGASCWTQSHGKYLPETTITKHSLLACELPAHAAAVLRARITLLASTM